MLEEAFARNGLGDQALVRPGQVELPQIHWQIAFPQATDYSCRASAPAICPWAVIKEVLSP